MNALPAPQSDRPKPPSMPSPPHSISSADPRPPSHHILSEISRKGERERAPSAGVVMKRPWHLAERVMKRERERDLMSRAEDYRQQNIKQNNPNSMHREERGERKISNRLKTKIETLNEENSGEGSDQEEGHRHQTSSYCGGGACRRLAAIAAAAVAAAAGGQSVAAWDARL